MSIGSEAKVSQFRMVGMIQQYVVVFQVKVNEASCMHIFSPLEDPLEPERGYFFTNSFSTIVQTHY